MPKVLITEETVRSVVSRGEKKIEVPSNAIITSLAAEVAAANGIKLASVSTSPVTSTPHSSKPQDEKRLDSHRRAKIIAFGSDHGGYALKESLKKHAETMGYKILDVGTFSEEPCDYPDFAYGVAMAVSSGEALRGVMIDGVGIGSCVVANKVPGIRAACCHSEFAARNAREHNDTNVLTLGSGVVGSEVCKEILKTWLESWFSGGRHKQRVDKISDVEKRFLK